MSARRPADLSRSEWAGPSPRPVAIDLFCAAGISTLGYYEAEYEVWGVTLNPSPSFPWPSRLIQADALEFMDSAEFAGLRDRASLISASPPCQGYSAMSNCRPGLADTYPRMIEPTRVRLENWRVAAAGSRCWVLENVEAAAEELIDPVLLCGEMEMWSDELPLLQRHRLFETSFPVIQPPHPEHALKAARAGHWTPGHAFSVAGHFAPVDVGRRAMGGVNWCSRHDVAEGVPAAYTRYVGQAALEELGLDCCAATGWSPVERAKHDKFHARSA